jgi:hypothetical protein
MERGGGAGRLCTWPAPRPTNGATKGTGTCQEDIGTRQGRAVYAVARAPWRVCLDGSAGRGQGAE